jgi:folate-dependent phosphoribosylglycinamide formyltransferase PurN
MERCSKSPRDIMMSDAKPIYSGKPEDFHWVGFGSGSGTNLRECAKVVKPSLIFSDKPEFCVLTKIGAKVATTDPEGLKAYGLESLIGVPRMILDGFRFCRSAKLSDPEEYAARSLLFNQKLVDELHSFEDQQGFGIDLIVLGGYMRMVGAPLLEAFPDKIINVHPAKLSLVTYGDVDYDLSDVVEYRRLADKTFDVGNICSVKGVKRRFIGEDAVYDAIRAGQKQTCSSVIMVDSGVDHGEILLEGPDVQVWDEYDWSNDTEKREFEREYSGAHQSLQKARSDWPALTMALKLISEGRLALGSRDTGSIGGMYFREWRYVCLDGEEQPYNGCFVNFATQKAID